MDFKFKRFTVGGILVLVMLSHVHAQKFERFKSPDASDRLVTYWMWLNGNVTKTGITKDLEAMKAAGINGTFMFSVGFYDAGPAKFMSSEWWGCVRHAIRESDRLKMTFGIYNSDGWSMSGGPWITPELSMKQIVWADTVVEGNKTINTRLPKTYFNLIYKDIAVLAFPALQNDTALKVEKVISSNLVINPESVLARNGNKAIHFGTAKENSKANMIIDFGKQKNVRRVVFDEIKNNPFLEAFAKLEYSNDGKGFTKIQDSFPLNLKAESIIKGLTLSFKNVTARYMRITVELEPSTKKPVPLSQEDIEIGDLAFYESPRVHLWEPKSGESKRIRHERQEVFMKELNTPIREQLPQHVAVNKSSIIDLTSKVDADGNLNWKAPKGRWIIQRVGYTSTNRMVGPATKEGRGLECNKMDSKAVETHFNAYAAKIIDLSSEVIGRPVDHMQMESWEAGIQNWTEGFEKEFENRNGYSILPYLPVLSGGYVVGSYDESDQFLWDFRNTASQLIAENYWGTMYRLGKARGVTVTGEGSGMQHYLYDPMRYQKHLDMPMGEFWPNEGHVRVDVKNASSVGHTYGHNLIGAEAFTSGDEDLWSVTPFDLKQIGDEAFTLGVNHFVLHTYVHQPYDIAPGFTLRKFGNHLQRLNPWFSQAKGWFDYLARCQYMLRQGKSVQDVAYFTGEGIPGYLGLPWELHPAIPHGYDYDGVNIEIIKQMTISDGRIYLPTGACYRVLVFQDLTLMTPELVTEIERLTAAGAHIISAKPAASPSLTNRPASNKIVNDIANKVWGSIDGKKVFEHTYGKGKMYYGLPVKAVLAKLQLPPDFVYTSTLGRAKVNFVHRQTNTSDSYFIANYEKTATQGKGVFRISNKVPELWDVDKGTKSVLPFRKIDGKLIEVPLSLDPLGSMFIVFKDSSDNDTVKPPVLTNPSNVPVTGHWDVRFVTGGDSLNTVFKTLGDWSKNDDPSIRYFSGSALYSKDVSIAPGGKKIELDLGELNNNLATVIVNGREAARLWKPPYVTDITPFVNQGSNRLEILVTNTAVNSLVGDEQYPPDLGYDKNANVDSLPQWLQHPAQRQSPRKTFVTFKYLNKDSRLDPSGMIGPVRLRYY